MNQISAEWAERVRAANDTLRDENDRLKAERDMWRTELGHLPTGEQQAQRLEELIALRHDLAAARRERDALKEALRTLVGHCDLGHTHASDGRRQAYLKALDDAREALEEANG